MSIVDFFNILIYQPLYNLLVVITNVLPGNEMGFAIIVLTIFVRLAILPLSHKSIKTQAKLRTIQPEITKLREKHKKNQQEQAQAVMRLYREHGVNPFSGCVLTLIQIPVIFGLYWVFWRGLRDGVIDPATLYSFIELGETPNFLFLGLLDLTSPRSIPLSFLAGISQFIQMRLSFPPSQDSKNKNSKNSKAPSVADELKKSFSTQARYVLPFIVGFVSLSFPGAIPLYWSTSNIFSIAHELVVRRKAEDLKGGKLETPQ